MPTVYFVHPDLGLGGAENLVVNAALGLQQRGHKVEIYTSHHDHSHCFQDTLPDGPLGKHIHTYGDWLPRTVLGRFHVICAILRMAYISLRLWLSSERPDVVFCDQVSHVVPLLKMLGVPVLFYCHFPDKLLCVERQSLVKRLYRAPVDWLEEFTTGAADAVVVNSEFTRSIFKEAFQSLSHVHTDVLYPAIDLGQFDRPLSKEKLNAAKASLPDTLQRAMDEQVPIILSVNRFERKKNLPLVVEAFAKLARDHTKKLHLALAGGYDPRVLENVEHLGELKNLVKERGIPEDSVSFVPSFSDDQKLLLMRGCLCVVYTPSNEHFGIVPIEAMYMSKPVVAVASGGPLESIVDGQTGFLRKSDADEFASAIGKLVETAEVAQTMGKSGREHVAATFSLEAFGQQLDDIVTTLGSAHQVSSMYKFLAMAFLLPLSVAYCMYAWAV